MGTIDNWERVIALAGDRVTIRIPVLYSEQMEIRARNAGRSINEEYGRAVEAWCGGGEGWTQILFPAAAIHDWVTGDVVIGQQLGAVLANPLEMPKGNYVGLRVAGYAITLDRQWFVSDEAFEGVRSQLAKLLPLLAETGGGFGPGPHTSTIFTYGRVGEICRKIGCRAGASELVKMTHTDSHGRELTIEVPVCKTHGHEIRTAIAMGHAPQFAVT